MLNSCPAEWPTLEVLVDNDARDREADLVIDFGDTGSVDLQRVDRRASFHTHSLSPEELVHPYLAPVAGSFALWRGHHAFHAGAVAVGGRAWGLLGDRELGKSSLLGWLAMEGHPVVTDDVLVADGTTAFVGPRCVDLREEVASMLGVGRPLRAGLRDRWRLQLDPVEPELPLGGWVLLAWGDQLEASALAASQRLSGLIQHHLGVPVPAPHPEELLTLAALPAWELRRPQGLDSLADAARLLLEMLT